MDANNSESNAKVTPEALDRLDDSVRGTVSAHVFSADLAALLAAYRTQESENERVSNAYKLLETDRAQLQYALEQSEAAYSKLESKNRIAMQALNSPLLCQECGKHIHTHRDGKCYPDTFPDEPALYMAGEERK